jgi:hypothetical protein
VLRILIVRLCTVRVCDAAPDDSRCRLPNAKPHFDCEKDRKDIYELYRGFWVFDFVDRTTASFSGSHRSELSFNPTLVATPSR